MMLRLAVGMKLFDAVAKINAGDIHVDRVAVATGADHLLTSETCCETKFYRDYRDVTRTYHESTCRHGDLQRGRARYFCTQAACARVRDWISVSRWGHPCVRGRVIAFRDVTLLIL